MNPKERVMRTLDFEEPDRIPVIPQITYATCSVIGARFIDGMYNAGFMAKALLAGYEAMGYDGVYVGWEASFNVLAEAMGCRLKIYEDSLPTIAENVVRKRQDAYKLEAPNPSKDGRLPIHLEAIKLVKSKVKDEAPLLSYVPGSFTLACMLRGMNQFLIEAFSEDSFAHELNGKALEASKAFAEAKVRQGADVITVADPCSSSTVISPRMFKELSLPYIKELLRAISDAGAIPSLHICGNTTPILDLMTGSGAKILELDAMVNLAEAKRKASKSKVCVMGNLNPSLLATGSPKEVELKSKECIEAVVKEGPAGFIFSTGCEVPLNAPIENVKAMVKASKSYIIKRN